MFFKKTSGIDWLIAGLGNPGKKYEGTRHNIGFAALDAMAQKWEIETRRSKFDALYGTGRVGNHRVALLKPQTFMNLSGQSLLKATDYFRLPPQNIIVLFDDISLAPGMLRIRKTGSAGGHNGIKSIITFLGEDFPRVKIGVGERENPQYDLADWVLSRFTEAEKKAVYSRFSDISAACELMMDNKFEEAMSCYNGEGKGS